MAHFYSKLTSKMKTSNGLKQFITCLEQRTLLKEFTVF